MKVALAIVTFFSAIFGNTVCQAAFCGSDGNLHGWIGPEGVPCDTQKSKQSFIRDTETVCKGQFKTSPYAICGDGLVSVTLPEGISGLNGIGKAIPMSIHIGDIGCWYGNFDGSGEISQSWTTPYNHVVVRESKSNPQFEAVSLGYIVFTNGSANLVLQKDLGGFTTNYNYHLNCSKKSQP